MRRRVVIWNELHKKLVEMDAAVEMGLLALRFSV
jgi:hypothetical protein